MRKLSDIPQDELLERAVRQPLDIVPAADVAQVPAGGKELLAPPLAPAIPPGASTPPPRLLLALERVDEYQRLIDEQRQQGKCVLLIVPDSLTAAYWQGVWPDSSLYLSDRKVSDREKIWNERQQGTGGIVTGGLAAVCLPLPNLGAIIVDRAGASLYHLAFSGLHVGELARIRARICSIPLLEGAAALTLDAAAHRTHYLIQDQRPQPPVPVAVRMLKKGEKKIPPIWTSFCGKPDAAGKRPGLSSTGVAATASCFAPPASG